jgi:hypothetical protein
MTERVEERVLAWTTKAQACGRLDALVLAQLGG